MRFDDFDHLGVEITRRPTPGLGLCFLVFIYTFRRKKWVYTLLCIYSSERFWECVYSLFQTNYQVKSCLEASEMKGNWNRRWKIAFGGACGGLKRKYKKKQNSRRSFSEMYIRWVYEDGYFEMRPGCDVLVILYIKSYMSGLECSDRSGNLVNREYCFRRIDIDVQKFSQVFLTKKLHSFEVGTM